MKTVTVQYAEVKTIIDKWIMTGTGRYAIPAVEHVEIRPTGLSFRAVMVNSACDTVYLVLDFDGVHLSIRRGLRPGNALIIEDSTYDIVRVSLRGKVNGKNISCTIEAKVWPE